MQGPVLGLLWRNPSGMLQGGLLVHKASVVTFKGLSSSHLSGKAKVPLHRIRGCSSTHVPGFWFSGRINDQIFISSWDCLKKNKNQSWTLFFFWNGSITICIFFWTFLAQPVGVFFFFLSHGYTWAWKWMWNLWVCFSWAGFKICLDHLINLVKSTQFQNSVPLLENFQFWEGMSSVCHHLEF